MRIILASGSPRRKQLLEWADLSFEVLSADIDETFPQELSPAEATIHIAKNKAQAVNDMLRSNNEKSLVIAADTIVVLDNRIIGKPANRTEAIATLTALSGNTHQVITGVCLLVDETETTFYETTEVAFHSLTASQISYYVDKYEPYDKAGAYAIQEWIGVTGVKRIDGDFYNVMGLPVSRVLKAIKELGIME